MERSSIGTPAVTIVPAQVTDQDDRHLVPASELSLRQDNAQHGLLVHFDRARRELALAASIDEVKDIRDKVEAMRLYARQQRDSLEMQNRCAEIKVRAERRLGEMLREQNTAERKTANLLRGRTVQPRDARPSLAELGISKAESSRWQLMSQLPEDQFEEEIAYFKHTDRELTSNAILKQARFARNEQQREEKWETGRGHLEHAGEDQRIRILHGDFRQVLGPPTLEPNSVDLIATDPPYLGEFVHLYGDLAKFAASVLKPGRLVAAHAGHYHLPEILRLMSRHLEYLWTMDVMYSHCGTQVLPRRIKSGWKPTVLFSKGKYEPEQGKWWLKDRIDCWEKSKDHHDWEQPLAESEYLVRALTFEGQLVVDPFMGSGTVGVACKKLKRRFVGSDVDDKAVQITMARLNGFD